MTKVREKELKEAKKRALKNPSKELVELMVDTKKSKNKKSSTRILLEMRYGRC